MKRIQRFCSLVLLAALWGGIPALRAQSFDKLWKQVEQAEQKDLPQTAVSLADEIYRKGKSERNIPQMLKSDIYRREFREMLTPDSFYVDLQGLEQWASSEPDVVGRAVLHSLVAGSYADYAGRNQRALHERAKLSVEQGTWPDDIREWSANMFVRRVMQHVDEALKNVPELLEASSSNYVPFIIQGDDSKYYHHDMYHLLASRCIGALQNISDFDADTLAGNKIASIYEQMINSYRQMPGREDAVVLTMLDYAKWYGQSGKAYPVPRLRRIGGAADRHLSLLDSIIGEYARRDVCAEAYLAKADCYSGLGRKPEALALCDEAIKRYPGYKRISALRNLRETILQPLLMLEVDKVAYPGDSLSFQVQHKNLEGFTLNLFRTTLAESPVDMPNINAAFYKKYARKIKTEHFSLSRPEDYKVASYKRRIALPDEPGNYILQLVPDDRRGRSADCFISLTRFKVMSITLAGEEKEFVVLDSKTGHPVADAQVFFYSTEHRKNIKELERRKTDASGKLSCKLKNNDFLLAVRKGTDTAMPPQHMYTGGYRGWGEHRDKAESQLVLLTDRSVYRPGQTVHVKGILYAQKSDTADVLPDARAEVVLFDVNRREISRKELRTNEFGSFATEFMLPSACLNGRYAIEATGAGGRGWTSIQVEEYKRPTFDIVFDAQKASYRVGDSVQVEGKASSFSGVPLQGLELEYTVTRDVYSWWWGYEDGGTPLVSGKVLIGEDGSFTIPVRLERNAGKDDDEVYYTYRITASVTNHAGETQDASTVLAAGNRSVVLSIDEEGKICKDDTIRLTFHARNLNGEPVALKGNYRLMQVVGKDSLLRAGGTFESNVSTSYPEWEKLPSGEYVLQLLAKDDQGRKVDYKTDFKLFSYYDNRPVGHSDVWCYVLNDEFDAAHPAQFSLGTSFQDAYVMLDIFSGKQRLESKAILLSDSLVRFDIPYQEAYGMGLEYLFTFVKGGRMYSREVKLKKRLPDKELAMKWEVFRDKLRPGQDEEWRLTIKTPQGTPAMAEMLVTMYDASLDKIYPNHKKLLINYPVFLSGNSWRDSYMGRWYNSCIFPLKSLKVPMLAYDYFYSPTCVSKFVVNGYGTMKQAALAGSVAGIQSRAMVADMAVFEEEEALEETASLGRKEAGEGDADDASAVELRTNFSETAFFYPQLRANEQGEISFSFTLPQSLTRWNFRGYAHTKGMLTGMLDASAVTSKEFMLSPNMPRFVRVGDKTSIAATITNLTGNPLKGTAKFILFDPTTEKVVSTQKQPFAVEAGKSVPVTFRFTATDKYNLLGVRIIADGGTFSDGEQHLLPVLSDKEYITETLAMPIRGEETRTFRLDSLFNRNSRTATDRRLTVEFTGNPAWYAVQALPVLSQPHTDNATAWAAAYYANTLTAHIANSQPRIKAVFDSWRMQDGRKETFLSQLQKNQDVKNILLEESPWLLEATTEAEQQARIATLFDLNNLSNGNITALTKLRELQGADGAWSWYKGMPGSRIMTGYITELLVRLPLLTGNKNIAEALGMQQKAFSYLHQQALEEYKNIRKAEKNGAKITGLSYPALHYLYLLAIADEKVPAANEAAYRYFLSMVGSNLNSKSMGIKAQSAVVLQKTGRASEANQFITSIKEHLVQTDERGAYFAFNETPFLWGSQPISVHVDVMEALHRAGGNDALVEEMKLWLLKQKQTTSWDSPVATADAIYALLCQGSDLLASRGDVRITLGGKVMETYAPAQSTVPGLGYIKESFAQETPEVRAKSVTVEKRDAGIAWGAVYAQYLSPISDVNRQGGELAVEKKLYVERTLSGGKTELQPVTASTRLKVGDKVVSRLTIRLDRAMDFVQLKDQRGACFEPMDVLSGYRWANRAGYYVEVKDASTNFFFDGLGKGVYVLEYSYRVARSGRYETGLATIQCAYAPEYAAHSASAKVDVE